MKPIHFLTAILAFLFIGCVTDSGQPARIIGHGNYSNSSIGLEFSFPETWQYKTDQKFSTTKVDFLLLAPAVNGITPNVNLIIGRHTGSTVMSDMLAGLHSQLQNEIADLSGYRDTVYSLDGQEIGETQFDSSPNGIPLHFIQVIFVHKTLDASMTFTDKADSFDANQGFKDIKASISITAD